MLMFMLLILKIKVNLLAKNKKKGLMGSNKELQSRTKQLQQSHRHVPKQRRGTLAYRRIGQSREGCSKQKVRRTKLGVPRVMASH